MNVHILYIRIHIIRTYVLLPLSTTYVCMHVHVSTCEINVYLYYIILYYIIVLYLYIWEINVYLYAAKFVLSCTYCTVCICIQL